MGLFSSNPVSVLGRLCVPEPFKLSLISEALGQKSFLLPPSSNKPFLAGSWAQVDYLVISQGQLITASVSSSEAVDFSLWFGARMGLRGGSLFVPLLTVQDFFCLYERRVQGSGPGFSLSLATIPHLHASPTLGNSLWSPALTPIFLRTTWCWSVEMN